MNTLIVTSVPILCSKGLLRTVLPRGKEVGARLYMFLPLKMIPIPLVTSFELSFGRADSPWS